MCRQAGVAGHKQPERVRGAQVVEKFTAHYVFALGLSRFISCAHWLLQIIDGDSFLLQAIGSGLWPLMVLASELVQTFILADFWCARVVFGMVGTRTHALLEPLMVLACGAFMPAKFWTSPRASRPLGWLEAPLRAHDCAQFVDAILLASELVQASSPTKFLIHTNGCLLTVLAHRRCRPHV